MIKFNKTVILSLILSVFIFLTGCSGAKSKDDSGNNSKHSNTQTQNSTDTTNNVNDIPPFSDLPYVAINNNIPNFTDKDKVTKSYEKYAELDSLGRCGVTMACIGVDIMPTEERGSIGQVKPSGWQTVKYDIVDGKYLYNRCHLIGYQLTGENANRQNLITGTRYLNIEGMLPFENMIADYVKETKNHVIYRVTPIFDGNNLVARGIQLEGYSVEDDGEGICFNVYAYNNQPGILINYANGESKLDDGIAFDDVAEQVTTGKFILNTNSKKYHKPDCDSVKTISKANKDEYIGDEKSLVKQGYTGCKNCIK